MAASLSHEGSKRKYHGEQERLQQPQKRNHAVPFGDNNSIICNDQSASVQKARELLLAKKSATKRRASNSEKVRSAHKHSSVRNYKMTSGSALESSPHEYEGSDEEQHAAATRGRQIGDKQADDDGGDDMGAFPYHGGILHLDEGTTGYDSFINSVKAASNAITLEHSDVQPLLFNTNAAATTAVSDVPCPNNNTSVVSSVTNSSTNTANGASRACIVNTGKTVSDMITNIVNEKVYPWMKFITCEIEMEPEFRPFGKKIMTDMKVEEHNQQMWWHAHKKIAKHALQQKRSSVGAAAKKSVVGKQTPNRYQ